MKITESDLLDAIRAALVRPPSGDATTVGEMAELTGRSEHQVRRSLKVIAKENRLIVETVRRVALDGRLCRVAGYRIKGKAK